MNAPICPTHGSPLRAGQKGGWFCPRKMPDQTYCPYRIKATAAAPVMPNPSNWVPVSPAPSLAAEPQTTSGHLILLGALDAAAKVYTGTGNDAAFLALVNEIILIHGDAK